MNKSRRHFVQGAGALVGIATAGISEPAEAPPPASKPRVRIATEEAMAPPELLSDYRAMLASDEALEPGFRSTVAGYLGNEFIDSRLVDIGEGRIRHMDANGITMHVLSIVSPGVQVLDDARAVDMARLTNDRLAAAVAKHPDRFIGLAAIAPQVPQEASRELERSVNQLGMRGALINSHTRGEYLDQAKYWTILETAAALDAPIYLHPRTPSPEMIKPFLDYGLDGAAWGFAVETALHSLRLICSGVFDRLPRLKIILGHMGELIPYWLTRIDGLALRDRWSASGPKKRMQRLPSEYFKENFVITTSGITWHPAFMLAHKVLGPERILFAVDYPFGSDEDSVKFLDSAPIPEADKESIYHLNARRLFKLGDLQRHA